MEKVSQRDLSNLMNVADSSAGRLLDRLERENLIERERNGDDRRVTYVKLTKKGKKLISDLLPIGEEFNSDLLEGITEEELADRKSVV